MHAAVTGLGVITATARNLEQFAVALRSGATHFDVLKRPGRAGPQSFPGAEITDSEWISSKPGLLRTASFSSQIAVETVSQAWMDARLQERDIPGDRIGIVIGGTNFQSRHQQQTIERYRASPRLIRPTYGLSFWDSDIIGVLSEYFSIEGESFCVSGASAGGAVAIIHAARLLESGMVDVAIAVGPLFDISYWECQAFTNLGAMGTGCRPFDRRHDGFVFGEGCAAIVLERDMQQAWGYLLGWGTALDASRSSHPDTRGQQRAIASAIRMADLVPEQIDYVNPHGTGSPLGDETELATLRAAGLDHCHINATKALTGHCLTASGAIEAIGTLIQLRQGFLHPTRNLDDPIDPSFRWVGDQAIDVDLRYAISNSFAFGGVSASIVFERTFR